MPLNIATKAQTRETIDIEIADRDTGEPLIGDFPDGRKGPCSVTIHAPGTKPYVTAVTAAENRNMLRIRQRGLKKGQTAEEKVAAVATLLTDLTISFNGFDYEPEKYPPPADGSPNKEMFRACYKDIGLGWLTQQVEAGSGDWGNVEA